MATFQDIILGEIQVGDRVQLCYGQQGAQTATGTVLRINEVLIHLKSEKSEPRILLDQIISFDILPAEEAVGQDNGAEQAQTPAPSAPAGHVLADLRAELKREEEPLTVKTAARLLRQALKGEPKSVREVAGGVLDSLENAVANHTLADKLHDLKARTNRAEQTAETEPARALLAALMGALELGAEEYQTASLCFSQAGWPELAAECLIQAGKPEEALPLLVQAALSGRCLQYAGCRVLGEGCREERNLSPIIRGKEQTGDGDALRRLLLAAAVAAERENVELEGDASSDPGELLDALFYALPASWKELSQEVRDREEQMAQAELERQKEEAAPEKPALTTTIQNFFPEQRYGFLRVFPDNIFFYVTQVTDQDLALRQLLAKGDFSGLEVSYERGTNHLGRLAASNIRLTERGQREAAKRLGRVGRDEFQRGTLLFYDKDKAWGKVIDLKGIKWSFKDNALVDPWLEEYCHTNLFFSEQEVFFRLDTLKDGKQVVGQMMRERPFDEAEISYLALKPSAARLEQWAAFNAALDAPPEVDESDPYEDCPYEPLAPEEDKKKEQAPLSKRVQPASDEKQSSGSGQESAEPPRPAPAPVPEAEPVRKATAWKLGDPCPNYEKAHQLLIRGSLDTALYYYKRALEREEKLESTVADLIGLYNRLPDGWQDAVDLFNQYRDYLTKEKALNLEIQIYQKGKTTEALEHLCAVLEQAIRASARGSRKSHHMIQKAQTYIRLGRYGDALETYRRWRDLYSQYRSTPEGDRLAKAELSVKKGEATCYYHQGEFTEAERLAKEVLRLYPADPIANGILDHNLGVGTYNQDEFNDLSYDDEDPDEDPTDGLLNGYVLARIRNLDLAAVVKSHISGGRYVGTPAEAAQEIRQQSSARGGSAKTRSDKLFAAARIIDELMDRYEPENRSGPLWKKELTLQNEKIYASRAIAAWGDYMVDNANQLDTARFAYLSCLPNLGPKNRCFRDSVNCFLRSYTMGQRELSAFISQQAAGSGHDALDFRFLSERSLAEALYPEFLVGVLRLMRELRGRRMDFKQGLYDAKPLRAGLLRQLGKVLGDPVTMQEDMVDFSGMLNRAGDLLRKREEELERHMEECARHVMGSLEEERSFHELQSPDWANWLDATDYARLQEFCGILRRECDYHKGMDFEHRAECLKDTIQRIDQLNAAIRETPTRLSFDVYVHALEDIRSQLIEQQANMYEMLPPMLTWELSTPPHYDSSGEVRVYLSVSNQRNHQTADTIEYEGAGEDIVSCRPEDGRGSINGLRGDTYTEVILLVRLTEQARQMGSFTLNLRYSYRYNRTAKDFTKSEPQVTELTCVVRAEQFRKLENPYTKNIGSPMHDESMFYGRNDELDRICGKICPPAAPPSYSHGIAIYGQTRTGKSSLLYHLRRRLSQPAYRDRVVIWEVQNMGDILMDSGDAVVGFFYHLLNIAQESFDSRPELAAVLAEREVENPAERILEKPDYASVLFANYMRQLDRIFRERGMVIVVLLDEFTYLHTKIKDGTISGDFMKFWKGFLQNYCVFAVVAGQDDMPDFIRENQNEFACMELMRITYLEEEPAKQLIREPLMRENRLAEPPFQESAVDTLYSLTAGSAYLTILLCANLVDYMNAIGAAMAGEAIVKSFLRTRAFGRMSFLDESIFEPQLNERGRPELKEINGKILLEVARISRTTGQASLREICAALPGEAGINDALDRLVQRNVLEQVTGDAYRIEVKLLERWLLETRGE